MTTVVAAVIERDQRILICRRSAAGAHPLKWEFPGGKVEANESEPEALQRELREELGIEAKIGREIARYSYSYPGKNPITLAFYKIPSFTGALENRIFAAMEWSERHDLLSFDFLEGDTRFLEILISQAAAES